MWRQTCLRQLCKRILYITVFENNSFLQNFISHLWGRNLSCFCVFTPNPPQMLRMCEKTHPLVNPSFVSGLRNVVSYPLRIIEGALVWMKISRHTSTQLHLLVKLFNPRWRCFLPLRDKHGLQRHLSLQKQSIKNFLYNGLEMRILLKFFSKSFPTILIIKCLMWQFWRFFIYRLFFTWRNSRDLSNT